MIRTADTYRKLAKVFTGSRAECRTLIAEALTFPKSDIVVCTRGNNDIAYYRPLRGEYINDKVWMMHYNPDGTWSLYL